MMGIFCCLVFQACGKSELPTASPASGLPRVTLQVKGISINVEVASTPEQTARGLMYRESLGENEGMLFVMPEERFLSFYMKNTLIPLSIAFLEEDGTIINIEHMEPLDADTLHWSLRKSRLALEMNQGWFDRQGVEPGDRIIIPPEILRGVGDL